MPKHQTPLLDRIGIGLPIVQAPMAGVSTPAMAAAVTNAGGLGSVAVGAVDVEAAAGMLQDIRRLTKGPFNVNVFAHQPAVTNAKVEAAWIERLRTLFETYGAAPPAGLSEIYRSFLDDTAMFELLLRDRPAVVSFHFGLPRRDWIKQLREAGVVLFSSATNLAEAKAAVEAGIDAVVAQGWEAGGHRGVFDPHGDDQQLGTLALTRILVRELDVPVIAAGGIMDGAGIAAVLDLGASAAQLGTAFIATDESLADAGYRAALMSNAAHNTVMTRAVSGRPARSLANRFTEVGESIAAADIPSYPIAYDLGKALHAAAKSKGEHGFGAQWAGQGAPLARAMSTSKLVAALAAELVETRRDR